MPKTMGNVSFLWFYIERVRKMTICSVNNVTKSFGGNIIFENISLEIKNGERVGLVGRNGSGKTTIFGLLTGEFGCRSHSYEERYVLVMSHKFRSLMRP